MDIFKRIFASIRMPVVKADEEELVDPQTVLRAPIQHMKSTCRSLGILILEECGQKHCSALQEIYDKCNKRVLSKKQTTETCIEELYDFMGCVDHCVAESLFKKLK